MISYFMIKLIGYANQFVLILIMQLMVNIFVLINAISTILDNFVLIHVNLDIMVMIRIIVHCVQLTV